MQLAIAILLKNKIIFCSDFGCMKSICILSYHVYVKSDPSNLLNPIDFIMNNNTELIFKR